MVKSGRLFFMRASKAALNMEMRNLAFQLKSKGVVVSTVNPSLVDTDFVKGLPKTMLRARRLCGCSVSRWGLDPPWP